MGHKRWAMAPVVLAGMVIALAGCSQPPNTTVGERRPAPAVTPEAAPSPTSEVNCETASQAEWMEHCAHTAAPTAEPEQTTLLPYGEPFDYVWIDETTVDNPDMESTGEWKVTLTEVECGLTEVADAEYNSEWQGSDDIPQYVPAVPEDGKEFCTFLWDWDNVGKIPGRVGGSGDLMIGDERHAQADEDVTRGDDLTENRLGVVLTDNINPGESTQSLGLYQVPEGQRPNAVWFPDASPFGGPSYLLVATE